MSERPTTPNQPKLPDLQPLAEHSVAMLAAALARFSFLLDRNEHRFNVHEERIATAIREKNARLVATLRGFALRLRHGDQERYRRIVSEARSVYWELHEHHRHLRHLSVPTPLAESITFINFAWNELRSANLPKESADALQHPPALCLSDLMQPSEHSYEDLSVVALSKLDHANVLAWPLLLHELGHNAIRDLEFVATPKKEASNSDIARRSWLIEMGCDLVGFRMAGPAYLAPFVMQAIMERSFLSATTKYPSLCDRAEFLIQQASSWRNSPLLAELKGLVESRKALEPQFASIGLDGTPVICVTCGSDQGTIAAFKSDPDLKAFVTQLDEKLPLPGYAPTRLAVANQIADTLKRGVLASSSHDPKRAQVALNRFLRSKKRRNAAFQQAKDAVCDAPNHLFDIVTAGWLQYFQTARVQLRGILMDSESTEDAFASNWATFVRVIAAEDELLRTSIEMADFHQRMVAAETSSAPE